MKKSKKPMDLMSNQEVSAVNRSFTQSMDISMRINKLSDHHKREQREPKEKKEYNHVGLSSRFKKDNEQPYQL